MADKKRGERVTFRMKPLEQSFVDAKAGKLFKGDRSAYFKNLIRMDMERGDVPVEKEEAAIWLRELADQRERLRLRFEELDRIETQLKKRLENH